MGPLSHARVTASSGWGWARDWLDDPGRDEYHPSVVGGDERMSELGQEKKPKRDLRRSLSPAEAAALRRMTPEDVRRQLELGDAERRAAEAAARPPMLSSRIRHR